MKVWLAVCLTAALVGDGWGSASVADRIIARRNVPDTQLSKDLLGMMGATNLVDGSFVPIKSTIFKPQWQYPYDVDADRRMAARAFAGGLKLNPVRLNIRRPSVPGLRGKLSTMKGGFKKLHTNQIKPRAREGWNKIKQAYRNTPDKSKILKEILKEAWSLLGNFDLRDIIFAALSEMGLIPECSCFLPDKTYQEMMTLARSNRQDSFTGSLVRCGCCIKPFDWKSLCMLVKVNNKDAAFEVSLEFDDKEFLNLPINFRKGTNGVAPPKSACVPEHRLVIGQERCAYIADLPFIDICIRPREIEIYEESGDIIGFGSCIQVVVDFLYYTYEKCFQFDRRDRKFSIVDDF